MFLAAALLTGDVPVRFYAKLVMFGWCALVLGDSAFGSVTLSYSTWSGSNGVVITDGGAQSTTPAPASIDWQGYYNRGYSKGETTGFNVGYADGRARGVKEGNINGRADGDQTGYDSTYQSAYFAAYGPAFEKAWSVGYDDGFAYGAPNGYLYGYDAALVELAAWIEEQNNNATSGSVTLSSASSSISTIWRDIDLGLINTTSHGSLSMSGDLTIYVRTPDPWEGYTPEGYEQKGYNDGYASGLPIGDSQGYSETYESTYQLAYAPAFDEGLKAGVVQGTRMGVTDGEAAGWDDGYAWGDSDGFNIGYGWGYADGWRAIYAGAYDLNAAAAFAVTIPEPSAVLVALSVGWFWVARKRFGSRC